MERGPRGMSLATFFLLCIVFLVIAVAAAGLAWHMGMSKAAKMHALEENEKLKAAEGAAQASEEKTPSARP